MTWTQAGLWLIGLGSLITVLAATVGSPRAIVGGIRLAGPLTLPRERAAFAADAAGLMHVAAGAIIIALVQFPPLWFAALILLTATVSAWLLAGWKQRQYRLDHRTKAKLPPDPKERAWREACLARCATWRWCLRHPLEGDTWPRDCWKLPGAPEPRGPS